MVEFPGVVIDFLQLFYQRLSKKCWMRSLNLLNKRKYLPEHHVARNKAGKASVQVAFQQWPDGLCHMRMIPSVTTHEIHEQSMVSVIC